MPEGFFTARSECIFLRVKAKPGAREDSILGVRGAELLVAVRVPPGERKGKRRDCPRARESPWRLP